MADKSPSESSEQIMLVKHLDRTPLLYCAVPNGGLRDKRAARMMVMEGVKRGVPDMLFFDPPPLHPECIGMAVELKRTDGVPSDISPRQTVWLDRLRKRGWYATVAYGYLDAVAQLRKAGYAL